MPNLSLPEYPAYICSSQESSSLWLNFICNYGVKTVMALGTIAGLFWARRTLNQARALNAKKNKIQKLTSSYQENQIGLKQVLEKTEGTLKILTALHKEQSAILAEQYYKKKQLQSKLLNLGINTTVLPINKHKNLLDLPNLDIHATQPTSIINGFENVNEQLQDAIKQAEIVNSRAEQTIKNLEATLHASTVKNSLSPKNS